MASLEEVTAGIARAEPLPGLHMDLPARANPPAAEAAWGGLHRREPCESSKAERTSYLMAVLVSAPQAAMGHVAQSGAVVLQPLLSPRRQESGSFNLQVA